MRLIKFLLVFSGLFLSFYFVFGAAENFPANWAWIGADCTNEVDCGGKTPPLGWISLDSSNIGAQCGSYKVTVDYDTGEISGAGWIGIGENENVTDLNCSENSVGWLYFDSNETPSCGTNGYPSDYCFPAKLVRVNDGWEIQGWAPVISKDAQGQRIIVTWVRFKGSNYVVKIKNDKTVSTQSNEQYAWSGKANDGGLGWIKFVLTTTTQFTCSLNAQPLSGEAPLRVTFNLNTSGCSGNVTNINWNGPCNLTNATCNYTYNNPGTYGPYTANVTCSTGEQTQCSSPQITVASSTTNFDVSVTKLDIRSFICKNNNPDTSYITDYLSRNPNYQFPPSTTAASDYMNVNQIERKTILQCPESQRNRPVEFYAKAECRSGDCPRAKLNISVKPQDSSANPYETFDAGTDLNQNYPKEKKTEYIFNNAYNYEVTACVVDANGNILLDNNPSDNCLRKSLYIMHYYCRLGFCAQTQRDWTNPPLYEKLLNTLGATDAPCRFWLNQICRARFGF